MRTVPRSRLLLLELVADLFIFALCAAVCVALLFQAKSMSAESTRLAQAVYIAQDAAERLRAHDWPGNVRELRNVLEFSAYLTPSGIITADALPGDLGRPKTESSSDTTLAQRVRAFEQREIRKALEKHGASLEGKKKAAAELGISLSSLYNKLGPSPS